MAVKDTQDPSANVILLVGNATKYLEELHKQSEIYYNQKLALAVEAFRREQEAEAERINSLRAVDVAAVGIANERAVKQAEVLATQVSTSAEALRILVAQTAQTIAQQLQSVTGQLIERIAALEKVQYETQGKSSAPTAMMMRLDTLEQLEATHAGASRGSRDMWGWVSAGILLIIAIVSFWVNL